MTHKIYTRIVLDWEGTVLQEEHYQHHGDIALCMPSDGGSSDGDRGSGGSTDSERGDAEGGFGGGDFGSVVGGPAAATDFSSAIEAALADSAMDTFGSMGLAGAYAGAATGTGFGGYAGALGTDMDFTWAGLFNDIVSTVLDKPGYTSLDADALAQAGMAQQMSALASLAPSDLARSLTNLDKIGMFDAQDYSPMGLATITPGRLERQQEIAQDLGLTSYDTMNPTFAKDIHAQALNEQVADINAAARATSYQSVVDAAIGNAVTSAKTGVGMTTEDMADLAKISVPEIVGTIAKFSNPVSAISGMIDVVGMLSNDITTRDVLGNITRGMSLSKNLGTMAATANMLAGGIPGLDVVSGLLGAGFGTAAYAGLKEMDREFSPSQLAGIEATADKMGVDTSATGDTTSMGSPAALSKDSPTQVFGGMGYRGASGGGEESVGAKPLKKGTRMVPFKPTKTRIIPFNNDDLYDKAEEPWYGKN